MNLKAIQDFKWSHRCVELEEFTEGQIIETEDGDLVHVSQAEGWAEQTDEQPKNIEPNAENLGAPENKAHKTGAILGSIKNLLGK